MYGPFALIGPLKGNMPYINIPLAPFKGGITGDKGKICPCRLRDGGVLERTFYRDLLIHPLAELKGESLPYV